MSDPLGAVGRKQCRDVRRTHNAYSCSFPPEELEFALAAQQERESFRNRNNEMVVDTSSVVSGLPESIEAFFFPKAASGPERDDVREQRRVFMEEYSLGQENAPLLVELDFASASPFRLAE